MNSHDVDSDFEPVTRRECYLHRKAMEDRVRNVETDLKEIKTEIRLIKEDMRAFFNKQESKWDRLWVIVLAILILVAIGRAFDLESWLGILI